MKFLSKEMLYHSTKLRQMGEDGMEVTKSVTGLVSQGLLMLLNIKKL